jgi:hypothetical protein
LIKIVIAYVVFEIIMIVVQIVFGIISWILRKAFFWTVDVIPAQGSDMTEAREVVLMGPIVLLSKKLTTEIENWTHEGTAAFTAAATNWRARMFFNAKERVEKRIAILTDFYERTGRQPNTLHEEERKKLLHGLDLNWFQSAIVAQWSFNALLGIAIIVVAIAYLS